MADDELKAVPAADPMQILSAPVATAFDGPAEMPIETQFEPLEYEFCPIDIDADADAMADAPSATELPLPAVAEDPMAISVPPVLICPVVKLRISPVPIVRMELPALFFSAKELAVASCTQSVIKHPSTVREPAISIPPAMSKLLSTVRSSVMSTSP